jgi:hypothetical protein
VQDTSNVMCPTLTVDGMSGPDGPLGAGVVVSGLPFPVHPAAIATSRSGASVRPTPDLNVDPASV